MYKLSKEGEQKLRRILYETLREQAERAALAYENRDLEIIRLIGHSLRGNSGAAYFHLPRVGEIGKQLQRITELDSMTFVALVAELNEIAAQLQLEIEPF